MRNSTISLQVRCSASWLGMLSTLRRLRLEVAVRHTALRLRAQHPLHKLLVHVFI
jgi:hypothetical protein